MEEKPAVATTSPVAAPNIQSKPLASPGKAINPETGEEYTPVDYSQDQLKEPPAAGAEEAKPAVDVNAPLQEPPGAETATGSAALDGTKPGADPATTIQGGAASAAGGPAKANRDDMPFGKAFAAARAAGEKQFTWKGKPYTTDVAKPGATPPAAKPGATPPATRGAAPAAPAAPFKKELPPELDRMKQLSGTKPVIPGGIADIANQVAGAKPAPLTAKESMERLLAITRLQ
jgi:hypothetical protein